MKTITVKNIFNQGGVNFPAFEKSGFNEIESAFITLDLESGELDIMTNNDKHGISCRRWGNIVMTWVISPYTTGVKISEILKENEEYFQNILDNSEVAWDGSNNVGTCSIDLQQDSNAKFIMHGHESIIDDDNLLENTSVDLIMTSSRDFNDIKDDLESEIDDNSCLQDPDLDIDDCLRYHYEHDIEEDNYTPEMIEYLSE